MKKTTLGLLVGVAACVGAAWYALRADGQPAAKRAPPPTTVSVVTPQRRDVPVLLQANGTVTPISMVDLHPQTTSTIVQVHIREGQFVRRGDLMFSLDARSERASVDKAQAQIARDEAALADVERQYQRSQDLLSKHFIAQGAVDTLKSQVDAARAVLRADLAAHRSVQVDASYATIRAPMTGRVGAINVYPGSLVQLGTSLATITQLDPINVAFTLPESSLGALLDAHRSGAVPVAATVGGGRAVSGQLSFIDNAVDAAAGTIRVKARFDNKDTRLWPGQYVNARLTVQTLKGALVIPQDAIITNDRGSFVYTVGADKAVQPRPVRRVYADGANAVVSGLSGDEQVVVDGKQNLRPGARVALAQPGAKMARGAGADQRGKPE